MFADFLCCRTVYRGMAQSIQVGNCHAQSYNKLIIILLVRSGSTGECLVLGFCTGLTKGRANIYTASLELNILS